MLIGLIVLGLMATANVDAAPNVYDCWDERKLERMDIDLAPHESSDPGLGRFTKMLKCLNAQSPGSATALDADWNQWSETKAKRPQGIRPENNYYDNSKVRDNYNAYNDPKWRSGERNRNTYEKAPDRQRRPPPSPPRRPPPRRPTGASDDAPIYGMPDTNPGIDSSPGIEPNVGMGMNPGMGPGMGPGMNPGLGPSMGVNMGPKKNEMDDRYNVKSWPPRQSDPRGPSYSDGGVVDDDDYLFFQDSDTRQGNGEIDEMSKTAVVSRKYGFVLMAFVVVCLAILMVFAIFCCNSSNSTMSQANNANAALFAAPDAFSIYSFNNGGAQSKLVAADTLRSVAMPPMHNTETMKSSRSIQSRGSPQFRVSDIDPRYHHHT